MKAIGLVLILISTIAFSQNKVDSLQSLLDKSQGELKVKVYNELFRATIENDPVRAIEYVSNALDMGKKINDTKGTAAAYNNLGIAYRNQGAFDKALENYINALALYESIANAEGIAITKNNIGNIYSSRKNFSEAMKYLEESHKAFVALKDKTKLVGSLNNLGNLHNELQLYDEALNYYQESYRISDSLGNAFSDPLNNMGNIYYKQGKNAEAIDSYTKAMNLARKNDNRLTQLNVQASLGELSSTIGQYKMAQQYLDSALNLAKELQAYAYLPSIYKNMALNFEKQGSIKEAYQAMKRYDEAREKVYSEESTRKIAQMEMALDLHAKEKELESLKADDEIKTLQLQKTRMIITLVILSIAVLVGGFNLYFSKRRTPKVKKNG